MAMLVSVPIHSLTLGYVTSVARVGTGAAGVGLLILLTSSDDRKFP